MMKKLLLFATIILLAVTILWMIAFYEHIQAYNRMIQDAQESDEVLGSPMDLRKPFYLWGNGPLLVISGFIIAFAWLILIYDGWKVLKQK